MRFRDLILLLNESSGGMNQKRQVHNKRFLLWLCVAFWMGLIFSLSAQPAVQSIQTSRGWTEELVKVFDRGFPQLSGVQQADLLLRVDNVVRKGAHAFSYFVLATLVMTALQTHSIRENRRILLTLLLCVLYAISDEVHQSFVPGRGPMVTDVLIDTIGASAGVAVFLLAAFLHKKWTHGKMIDGGI